MIDIRMHNIRVALIAVLLGLGCLVGNAEETMNKDGNTYPTVWGKYPNSLLIRTRTSATYPKGLSVFTLVYSYQDFTECRNSETGKMGDLPDGVERRQSTFVLWGEYGFTDRFLMGINAPIIHFDYRNDQAGIDDSTTGLGDMSLYAKGRLIEEDKYRPALAIEGFLKVPTGDKDKSLGNGETDITIGGSLSKRYGSISGHVNPEYTFTGGSKGEIGASADDRFRLNCGGMWHATPSFMPSIEWNGLWWGAVGHQQEIGGGFLWFPVKTVSIKAAVAVPMDTDLPWKVDWMPWIKVATWF